MDQVIEWLNENENRAYPLLEDSTRPTLTVGLMSWVLPDNFLLDAQIVLSTSLTSAEVYLTKITTSTNGNLTCYIGTLGYPELQSFTISPAIEEYPLYLRNSSGSLLVFGSGASECPFLGQNAIVLPGVPFEPGVCYQFNDAWLGVSSISAVPEKLTEAGSLEPHLPLEAVLSPSTLVGDVSFLEGYNFSVKINNNLIDLGIGTDYGLRMTCETNFLEQQYLDCDSLVCFINGVPPDSDHNFRLLAGSNISIINGNTLGTFNDKFSEESNDHTIFVGLTFQQTDICSPVDLMP